SKTLVTSLENFIQMYPLTETTLFQKPLNPSREKVRKPTDLQRFNGLSKNALQLNPPYNLSVMWNEQDSTLLLQWNSSSPPQKKCVVYMVRNQKDTSQVSQNKPYVFQVRSTVADTCGDSDLWSDWSDPVEWGSTGEILLSHSERCFRLFTLKMIFKKSYIYLQKSCVIIIKLFIYIQEKDHLSSSRA
uniref:Cytokine receptor common subunit gamma-like n=1 Tax=Sinocyclocheilus rhinocerous TaxID=307959 RepID=A0A673JU21_9TELE